MPLSASNRAHVLSFSIRKEESEEEGEIEDEVATTSRKTQKGNLSKLSTEGENLVNQIRFVAVKKNKIKRRNGNLKSAVNSFNKLVDSNPTKELVEYFKGRNKKSREHKKALMQMHCNI